MNHVKPCKFISSGFQNVNGWNSIRFCWGWDQCQWQDTTGISEMEMDPPKKVHLIFTALEEAIWLLLQFRQDKQMESAVRKFTKWKSMWKSVLHVSFFMLFWVLRESTRVVWSNMNPIFLINLTTLTSGISDHPYLTLERCSEVQWRADIWSFMTWNLKNVVRWPWSLRKILDKQLER